MILYDAHARARTFNVGTWTTYTLWKDRVDAELEKLCGLTSDDLPDCDYWHMWDAKYTPRAAAKAALRWARSF